MCKGNSIYRLLKAMNPAAAAKYLKNQREIAAMMKRRRANTYNPMTPDVKAFSKN